MAEEEKEKKEIIDESFRVRIINENGEELFDEEDLDFCDISIGTMQNEDGASKSDQLYYMITAEDEPDENNEVLEFEVYAPVNKCTVIKQRNYRIE